MNRKQVINILELYFEGLINSEVNTIPLHPEVTFSGPMVEEGLSGKDNVYSFLVDVSGAFANVQYHIERDIIDGNHICSVVKLRLAKGQVLEMCNVFEIVDGQFKSIRSYYDRSQLMK